MPYDDLLDPGSKIAFLLGSHVRQQVIVIDIANAICKMRGIHETGATVGAS